MRYALLSSLLAILSREILFIIICVLGDGQLFRCAISRAGGMRSLEHHRQTSRRRLPPRQFPPGSMPQSTYSKDVEYV